MTQEYNHHLCCSGNRSKPRGEVGCACLSIHKNTNTPYYEAHWADWHASVFLGTERNPDTKMVYDYWLVNTGTDIRAEYSWTCKHGAEGSKYGSGRVDHLGAADFMPHILEESRKDFIFGITRAKYLALLYLATGQKPLCQLPN